MCSTKSMDLLTLKGLNSFQNKNNIKARYSFAHRPQISIFHRGIMMVKRLNFAF